MNGISSTERDDWIKRLSPVAHHVAILIGGLSLLLMIGALVGFIKVMVTNDSALSLTDVAILTALAMATLALARLAWRLTAIWRRPGRSAFEQRYTRMWLVVVAISLPGGIALGYLGDTGSTDRGNAGIFSDRAIAPELALAAAAALAIGLVLATVLYHRTVDDHEERAYLWGSSVAFHFLAIALPVAWLLARGGLLALLGTGAIAILLLMSVVLQGVVFIWLKYR